MRVFFAGLWLSALSLSLVHPASAQSRDSDFCAPAISAVPRIYPAEALSALHEDGTGLIVGDSIAAYWQVGLEPILGSNVVNLGFPQDQPGNVLWRLDKIEGRRHWIRALIIAGVNSSWKSKRCDVASGIESIVAKVRSLSPQAQILVMAVLPHGPSLQSSLPFVDPINASLKADALNKGFIFVDPSPVFLANCENKPSCPLLKMPGWLHPTQQGYDVMARAAQKAISLSNSISK
ncbi:hypothetical protein ACELLULO517_06425 [Acidisoma cellulosilytica]|uniref:SGNH hydrolase-type esterase domain-containing protein n=1 Tax=Acidisoma cellulosilyticum TaxID=2802395 RepID=A0A963YZ44_9PROT|nr:GDSL-type esterase/lipase family protein [Acidisoma cellulosilyticum]MCB8879862.1 hypothetical protein [Acidisoma cellulosilyticum]